MRWAEIRIETTPQAQDAIGELMIENGCAGLAIEGESPLVVRCYLPVDDRLEERLLNIQIGLKELPKFDLEIGTGEITVKYSEDKDWAEAWKSFFHTTKVGRHIVVKPSWESYTPEAGDIVLEIDPGMAFGTGNHPTTKLCLEMLEKYMRGKAVVVDFGTGSGILAVAAAKLGAGLVIAFDSDEVAVRVARENVQGNEAEQVIEVHHTDNPKFINSKVDVIIANIVAEVILSHLDSLAHLLKQSGVLIASGIIKEKQAEVERAIADSGLQIVEAPTEGEWVAIVARKTE